MSLEEGAATSGIAAASGRPAMKLIPGFADHRKITRNQDSGKAFARRTVSSRSRDVMVAATLLVLFVAAIARHAPVNNETGDSSVNRRSDVAFLTDVVATLGLSIGLAWLLFSSRPRADDEETRS
jgi:hypothetical protein